MYNFQFQVLSSIYSGACVIHTRTTYRPVMVFGIQSISDLVCYLPWVVNVNCSDLSEMYKFSSLMVLLYSMWTIRLFQNVL